MNLNCKQCGYDWNTREAIQPKVCPRCKSKNWNKKTTRPWDKKGFLYVIEMKDGSISVGQTKVGDARLLKYVGVKNKYLHGIISDLNKSETKLIAYAKKLCGEPIKGRELFNCVSGVFDNIVNYIAKTFEIREPSFIENDFDFSRAVCLMAIEQKLPYLKIQKKDNVVDAKKDMLLIGDAMEDVHKGVCTPQNALESLASIFTSKFMSAVDIYDKDIDIKTDYDDIIHDVIDKI